MNSSPSPIHPRREADDEDYLDQQESKYLEGISASFNHTDFVNNVKHVLRIRRHALKHSGPSKEDYYQSLVESYKRQQQESEAMEKYRAALRSVEHEEEEKEENNSNEKNQQQEQDLRKRLKLIGKNNTQAAEARKRIKDAFGEDYGAAGRALLYGARLPETAKFDDCTKNVAAAGSRATLWARTLKQWRRDKSSGVVTNEDTRATQAMDAVSAKFEQEDMRSRLTGEEVQEWANHIIKQNLCERTKGIVGRIQTVITCSRKSERQRIRRDYFKQNPNAPGADRDEFLSYETKQQQLQEELYRILSQGGDFTKNMSPELHGLWLRSLLPGQKLGDLDHEDDYDDDEDDEDEDDDENDFNEGNPEKSNNSINNNKKIPMAPETDVEVMTKEERAKFSEKLVDELPQNIIVTSGTGSPVGASSPVATAIRLNARGGGRKFRITDALARAAVDPKMLEPESIRERAKKVLVGEAFVTTRHQSSLSSSSTSSTHDHHHHHHHHHGEYDRQSINASIATFGIMNTPLVSEVAKEDIHRRDPLLSPQSTNEIAEQQPTPFITLSKNPTINNFLAGAARRKQQQQQQQSSFVHDSRQGEKNNNHNNNVKNCLPPPPPSPFGSSVSQDSSTARPDDDHDVHDDHRTTSASTKKNEPVFVFGGANLSQVKTAKEAHEKILHLLEAELHDEGSYESFPSEAVKKNNNNLSEERKSMIDDDHHQQKMMKDLTKYEKATQHWGDSRHALIWDFEMDQIRESVAREIGHQKKDDNRTRDSIISCDDEESQHSNIVQEFDHHQTSQSSISSSTANGGPTKKSERLQKLERTIHLLETKQIGNFVAKEKFYCRLERNRFAVSNQQHQPDGAEGEVSVLERTGSTNFGQQSSQRQQFFRRGSSKFRSMHEGGSIIGGGMEDEASFRSTSKYAPASDVLASSPKHQLHQHQNQKNQQQQQQFQQPDISTTTSTNNQKQKVVAIPELDKPFGKYQCALDIKLSHLDPATEKPFSLRLTNMPEPDLYAYQRYAREKNMVIIIRPVSQVVPQLYATPGLHIKGKSINVSLKSSSYRPIDGLIPVNPALGKAYLDAMRREREIEDMILNATGGVVTVSLLKRLRAQKAAAGSLTQAFRRDIINALERSETELNEIMEEYRAKLVVTVDKETVSRAYIERFNEAQFLGTTHAKWKDQGIFYREIPGVGVERDPREAPVFYIETQPGVFSHYSPEADALDDLLVAERTEELHPVMVVTHRMFTVSETTKRIEPDPTLFMIGPDFDGLVYGRRVELAASAQDRVDWSLRINDYRLNRTMGLVNEFDIEHVKEVRLLTEWKQNHGYECGNTVKTQPVTVAAHAVITPDSFTILNTIYEIVSYIRTAWKHNIPLLVNPNWRVVLDYDLMPRLYGEDLALPVVDDCGASAAQTRFEVESVAWGGASYDSVKKAVGKMSERAAQMRKDFRDNNRNRSGGGGGGGSGTSGVASGGGGGKLGGHHHQSATTTTSGSGTEDGEATLEEAVKLVIDKKEMSELFFSVRRWQMMPPVFIERNGNNNNSNNNKTYGNGDERTRWDAPFDDPVVNQEFEKFRKSQVDKFLVDYQKGKQEFLLMHGERSSRAFIDVLDDYLFPEPYPRTV